MSINNQKEIWLPIKGFDGRYEISNLGRVKSLSGKMWGRKPKGERILSPVLNNGYYRFLLYANGRRSIKSVHRVVAEAFIVKPESKCQVNHINGIKTDNRVENLEWVTAKENIVHAHRTGLTNVAKGSRVHGSKLKEEQIPVIRSKYKSGAYTQQELADEFSVSLMTINLIVLGKTWRYAA